MDTLMLLEERISGVNASHLDTIRDWALEATGPSKPRRWSNYPGMTYEQGLLDMLGLLTGDVEPQDIIVIEDE